MQIYGGIDFIKQQEKSKKKRQQKDRKYSQMLKCPSFALVLIL